MRELVSNSRAVWLYAAADARRAQAKVHCAPLFSLSTQDLKKEVLAAVDISTRFPKAKLVLAHKLLKTNVTHVMMLPGPDQYMLTNRRSGRLELTSRSGDVVSSHDLLVNEFHFSRMGYVQISDTVCYAWKAIDRYL
jgi:hypothetical protein